MKKSLILPSFLLFTLVACNNGTTSTSEPISEVLTIAEEDKARPVQGNFDFSDYNETNPDYNESKWYINKLKDIPLPDPYVIEEDGTYYIYGTTDRTGARTFDCYSTTDFNNFTLHKDIYVRDNGCWSGTTTGLFAPEVAKFDDTYYLYYSAEHKDNGRRYIDVLVSESPTGPFVAYEGTDANGNELNSYEAPIFRHNDSINLGVLDQTLFIDDDGKMYMYYSVYDTGISQYIVGFEMLDPVTPNWDTYKVLVRPGEPTAKATTLKTYFWEAYTDFEVAEGPQMIKSPINGKYYLTYSVNHYPDKYYTVCYAVSDTPLGDYKKPYTKDGQWTNLFFGYAGGMESTTVYKKWDGFMSGTAHHCFFKIGEQVMIGYHAHQNRKGESARYFGMDKVFFAKDGVPFAQGPSATIQTLPEAISGYKNIAPMAKVVATDNVAYAERINDNFIVEHYNLAQEANREVEIRGEGKAYIELIFDKEYEIGGIQIVNSAFYEYYIEEVNFINFFNENAILDSSINYENVNPDTEFVFPASGLTFDINGISANKLIICIDVTHDINLNEIIVLGK